MPAEPPAAVGAGATGPGAASLGRPAGGETGSHHGRPHPGHLRRLGHHRPHLAGGLHRPRLARGPVSLLQRGRPAGLQHLRLPAGEPRGDDAGHVRQRADPQPDAPRRRGRVDRVPALGRGDAHLRGSHAATWPTARRRWSWRARSTGPGSSRDWAAKGPALLGVKAVIAEGFERIHRSNLVGMGILPLQFEEGATARGVGLTPATRICDIMSDDLRPGRRVEVRVWRAGTPGARPAASPISASGPWHGWTPRSTSTTTTAAASCRTSCGHVGGPESAR